MSISHNDSTAGGQQHLQTPLIEMEEQIATQEQHSLLRSITLHLVPGVLIFVLFLLFAPWLQSVGFPPFSFTAMLIGLVVLGATLAELFFLGRKRHGRLSLKGIVLYHKPMPWWQYILLVLLFDVYAFLVLALLTPFLTTITHSFSWWPGYNLRLDSGHYTDSVLLVSYIIYFLCNGFIAPAIEELYFRGYLMPRLSRFGIWTPFLSIILFLGYHFWQPWNIPVYLIALWPLSYFSWRKRNVYLAIALHMSINVIPMLFQLSLLFAVIGRVFGHHA